MNNKVMLNLDNESFKSKPSVAQTKAIQSRIGSLKSEVTINDLFEAVTSGVSFKAGALNGNKNQDWESQDIFALDFDNSDKDIRSNGYISIGQALERCRDYEVLPAFYYETFSSQPDKEKFRLVFLSDVRIADVRVRSVMQHALMMLFPESDKACKDLSRLFFGGRKGKLFDKCTINVFRVVQSATGYTKETVLASNYLKRVQQFCNASGLNMKNDYPDIKLLAEDSNIEDSNIEEYKSTNFLLLYIYNRKQEDLYSFKEASKKSSCNDIEQENESIKASLGLAENFPAKEAILFNFSIDEESYKQAINKKEGKLHMPKVLIENIKHERRKPQNYYKFDVLKERCRLWSEFINGDKILSHDTIFNIACNMWRVSKAKQLFTKAINDNDYSNKLHKINIFSNCSKLDYNPVKCEKFCPYKSECKNENSTMLHATDNNKHSIRRINESETISLEQAEIKLKEVLYDSYNTPNNKIYVIKAPTGIGKTTLLKSLGNYNNLCISYPTHELGEDIISRLNIKNSLHLNNVNIPFKEYAEEYNKLLRIGAYKESNDYLLSLLSKVNGNDRLSVDLRDDIKKFLESNKLSKLTKDTIFCTHKKMLMLNNKFIKTYIIDEDIVRSALLETTKFKKKWINSLLGMSMEYDDLKDIIINIKNVCLKALDNPGKTFSIPKMKIPTESVNSLIKDNNQEIKYNLRNILESTFVMSDTKGSILFIKKNSLPNAKCIILSATANEFIYKNLFKDREIEFIDIGQVMTRGKVMLHYMGFSKTYMKDNIDKAIAKVKRIAPDIKNVITYNKYKDDFEKAGFNSVTHFGACSGLDKFSGYDLIVSGTPHITNEYYLLFASLMLEKELKGVPMEYTNVKRNGFEFSFTTFNDDKQKEIVEILREIQFYSVESELIQAAGRARVLRTMANVHLFSNLPLRESILFDEIYK